MLSNKRVWIVLTITILVLTLAQSASISATPSLYLPWRGGQEWEVLRGNYDPNDPGSHNPDNANRYAWDFRPTSSTSSIVVAAADGTVCYVQESIPDSAGFTSPHAGNTVVIAHEGNCTQNQDGVYSFYAHLQYNSVSVSEGQSVNQGD